MFSTVACIALGFFCALTEVVKSSMLDLELVFHKNPHIFDMLSPQAASKTCATPEFACR
jgi:hypothetical protein